MRDRLLGLLLFLPVPLVLWLFTRQPLSTLASLAVGFALMATHRLYQWARQGKDLATALPYLSAYLGHAQLSDTYYYIHLVPDTAQPMAADVFSALLPEADGHE